MYLEQQAAATRKSRQEEVDMDRVLHWLLMCDKFGLGHPKDDLVRIAASTSVKALMTCPGYSKFESSALTEIFRKRCEELEKRLSPDERMFARYVME
jgi:hypothetical protein